jgi:MFS family permease
VYYGFALFLTPMERDLGFSRVALTGVFSLGLLTSALIGLPVGRWIDRHGARGVMTLGSCAAVALMLAWARVESLWALYVVWGLMGLAMAATLYEPAFAAIVGWFAQHRDRALLTLTLVAGLASTIFVPIEAALLARMDWRTRSCCARHRATAQEAPPSRRRRATRSAKPRARPSSGCSRSPSSPRTSRSTPSPST